jgi:hypothetical protein
MAQRGNYEKSPLARARLAGGFGVKKSCLYLLFSSRLFSLLALPFMISRRANRKEVECILYLACSSFGTCTAWVSMGFSKGLFSLSSRTGVGRHQILRWYIERFNMMGWWKVIP